MCWPSFTGSAGGVRLAGGFKTSRLISTSTSPTSPFSWSEPRPGVMARLRSVCSFMAEAMALCWSRLNSSWYKLGGKTQVSSQVSELRGQTSQLTSKLGGSPLLEVAGRAPCCGREDGCPGIHQASGEERGPVGRRRVCLVLVPLHLLLLHLPLHPSAWRTPMQTPHGKLLTSPPEGYQHSKIKIYSNLS